MSKFEVGQQVRVMIPSEGTAGFYKDDTGKVVKKAHDNDFEWLVESEVWPDRFWFYDYELEAIS